jgi:hypothetical protein
MSEITKKFEDGTYTQDELLDWHDSYGENMMYQNSLKNLSEDQFENTYTHQDEDFDYKIGEVNEVPVVYNKQIRPKIFGQNLDDLKGAGQKTVDVIKATPGFLKDFANPVNIAKGLNEGVTNFFNLIDSQTGGAVTSIDNYFKENFPNTLGKSFEYEKPDTAGGITSSVIGQYVVPDLLFRRFLPMFKGQGLTSDALTVGLFSSKDEGNIASMIGEMFPNFSQNNEVAKIITEGLTANEDDSELEARLKNVVSDSGALFALSGIYKIFKNLKNNPEKVQEYQSLGAAATPTTKEDLSSMGYVDSDGFVKTNIVDEDLAISNYERIKFDEGSERPFKVFLKGEDIHQKSFTTQEEAENFINQDIIKNKGLEDKNAIVRSKSEKPFYSNVENAISNMTMKSGNGDQILATLNNTSGIKQSEIEDLGLNEFLAGKKKVTKEELDDFIADKSLTTRVKDTVLEGDLGAKNDIDFANGVPEEFRRASDFDDAMGIIDNNESVYIKAEDYATSKGISIEDTDVQFNEDFLKDVYGMTRLDKPNKPTRFSSQTLPGGEDYKEILITAPGTPQVYTKHHFRGDVPDGENLIAHARFNTREINGKKTLFIEEIQSDLHQAGRKEGYQNNKSKLKTVEKLDLGNQINTLNDELRTLKVKSFYTQTNTQTFSDLTKKVDIIDGTNGKTVKTYELTGTITDKSNVIGRASVEADEMNKASGVTTKITDLSNQISDLKNKYDNLKFSNGVADAPFKKNWHELTMKRLIKYAVDNDFEAISFTPGSVQNARYDLSAKVDSIRAEKIIGGSKDGQYELNIKTFGQGTADRVIPENQLEEFVGKDLANKIINDAPTYKDGREYSGLDLEFGGQGMEGFYDKMLPTFLKNFGKKYNAKLEKTFIGEDGTSINFVEGKYNYENTRLREAKTIEDVYRITKENKYLQDEFQLYLRDDINEPTYANMKFNELQKELGDDIESYINEWLINDYGLFFGEDTLNKVPFMVITPEMKKDILTKGVPIAKVEDREEKTSAIA